MKSREPAHGSVLFMACFEMRRSCMGKRILALLLAAVMCVGCTPDHDVEISHKERNTMEPDNGDDGMEEAEGDMTPVTIASLVIDDERYNIDKNVNYTAKQFFHSVGKESLEITLKENGGFEKCAELPWEFDTLYDKSCQVIGGDIVLYQGKTICLIYGENTADYTRIGRIETTVDEREALMKKLKKAKDVKVRFEVEYTE